MLSNGSHKKNHPAHVVFPRNELIQISPVCDVIMSRRPIWPVSTRCKKRSVGSSTLRHAAFEIKTVAGTAR